MKLLKLFILFAIYFLSSCDTNSIEVIKKAVYLDSQFVSGLRYKCGKIEGITDEKGLFLYNQDSPQCEFYLGANKLVVKKYMLEDSIVTPFELTTSKSSAFELSRIIQSLSVKKDKVLVLNDAKVIRLSLVDLTNPVSVSTQLSAVGAYVKNLTQVKKSLEKKYDLKTGMILQQAQKQATTTTKPSPTKCLPGQSCDKPITPVLPAKPKPAPTPTVQVSNCPIGVVCQSSAIHIQDTQICMPGVECKIPQKDNIPCFPGADCDTSKSDKQSCLPGQDCDISILKAPKPCLPGQACNNISIKNQPTTCLPGQACTQPTVVKTKKCLPGSPCNNKNPKAYNPPTIQPPTPTPNDNDVCLPGSPSCATSQSNLAKSQNINYSQPTNPTPTYNQPSIYNPTYNNQSQSTQCLPGQIC